MWKNWIEILRLPGKREWTFRLMLLILLLAAVPRIFLLVRASAEDFLHNDGKEYMEISRQLSRGNGFSLSYYRWHEVVPPDVKPGDVHPDLARTPLFPLLGAVLFLLPFDVIASAKVVSLMLSLLAVWCVFLLGRELAGRACGIWSAFLFAFYPYALYYSASWSTENLFLICLSLSFLFLLKAMRGHFGSLPWCGLWLGLTALTRPTAILLPAVFGVLLWFRFMVLGGLRLRFRNWKRYRKPEHGAVRNIIIALLLFSAVMFPWMCRNRMVAGTWNPATYYDGYIFWLSFSPIMHETYRTLDRPEYAEASEKSWNKEHAKRHRMLKEKGITTFLSASEQWRRWGREQILSEPWKAVYLLKERFVHYWRMCPNLMILKPWQIAVIRIYFTVLFLLALAGCWWLKRRLEIVIPLIPVFFGMAISIPFLFVLRFRFPFFAPYLCVLAGLAVSILTGKLIKKQDKGVF